MIVTMVQAKAKSRRLPHKNLFRLPGYRRTLTDMAVEAAKLFAKASDSRLVYSGCQSCLTPGLWPCTDDSIMFVRRPAILSGDKHSNRATLLHAITMAGKMDARGIMLFQPSNPFRTSLAIDTAVQWCKSGDADVMMKFANGQWFWIPTEALVDDRLWFFEDFKTDEEFFNSKSLWLDIDEMDDLLEAIKIASSGLTESKWMRMLELGTVEKVIDGR